MDAIRIDQDLTLRQPVAGDAAALFALVEGNRAHLRQWLPWVDSVRTLEDEERHVERMLAPDAESRELTFLVEYKGRVVGTIGLRGLTSASKAGEIGYWLAEDAQGKGIMTRSCEALLDYAFSRRGMHRMQIRAATGNARSRAIPDRLGFILEGVQREAELLYDHYVDLAVYGLLEGEWRGRRRGGDRGR
ncbi:MAG: GNAT family N-acetyltransferase [Chloroflexi bacterium]|nr:GNAT family N-acetyltransferase [Chloroflexota bacterium]